MLLSPIILSDSTTGSVMPSSVGEVELRVPVVAIGPEPMALPAPASMRASPRPTFLERISTALAGSSLASPCSVRASVPPSP